MQFYHGSWWKHPDITAYHPARCDHWIENGHVWSFFLSNKPGNQRVDTLNGMVWRFEVRSPQPGIFRIRYEHFRGKKKALPTPAIADQQVALRAEITEHSVRLHSGSATLELAIAGAWHYRLLRGNDVLTTSHAKAFGLMEHANGTASREQLELGIGELVYGGGERFEPLTRNGQTVDIWNADVGTNANRNYKNIPILLCQRGWAVQVNSHARVTFEVQTEHVERLAFHQDGHSLDYALIVGDTIKSVVSSLTNLTGRPPLVPEWSFGLWLSTSFTTDYDEATVMGFLDGMAEREIPVSVFHFDCFWMRGLHWCDFQWDPEQFPDPEGMLQRLHQRGIKVCVWINPYIAECSPLFDIGMAEGYLLQNTDGSIYQRDWWQAGMGIVDFTNPKAVHWYQEELRRLIRQGVDVFKTDFGEDIPDCDVAWHDGSDPALMHNAYALIYNQIVMDVLQQERGDEAIVFARSAATGSQNLPVHWGGDSFSTFRSMANSLRAGLSLGLAGFAHWTTDLGGFEAEADPAVYKRWCAWGCLCSHSRLHGSKSYRVPWLYDEEAVSVLRAFVRLRKALTPYLQHLNEEAQQTGLPMLRPMVMEFPDDPTCAPLDRQYMFGDALLVAPVFATENVHFYLPAGEWVHLLTGASWSGERWYHINQSMHQMPIFIRPGKKIPVQINSTTQRLLGSGATANGIGSSIDMGQLTDDQADARNPVWLRN